MPKRKLEPATLDDHDLEDEGDYEGLAYQGLDLSERRAALVKFDECTFESVQWSATTLRRATFMDCGFRDCDLANLRTENSTLIRVQVAGSRATGLQWTDGSLRHAEFTGCRMDLAGFRFSKFEDVRLVDCNLAQGDFTGANLGGATFVNCDLTGAQFHEATAKGARFENCGLDEISGITYLEGAVIDAQDLIPLAFTLARGLGIVIPQDEGREG